jgi:hypothetical protein
MKKQINALNYLLTTTLTSIVLIGVACALPQKANAQESRSCVTWEEVKSEVESLYSQFLYSDRLGYSHPLPELPDGFKNGCVFGDSGASTIAISVSKDEVRTRIAQDYDTIFGVIPHYSSIVDVEPETDKNKQYLNFYNICSSVGTASTTFCQDLPTDSVYIKEESVCLQKLCIKADSTVRTELVRLWNEALEQRQIAASAVSARICTRDPDSNVTLRTGSGIDHPMGLVQVGSGGVRIDNYFRQRNYTVEDGEEVSIFSKTHGTDGRVWYEIGTNQWVAWVRSDFVGQSPSEF